MIQHREVGAAAGPAGPCSPPQKGQRCAAQPARPERPPDLTAPWFSACSAAGEPPPLNSCYPPAAAPGISSASAGKQAHPARCEAPGIVGETSQLTRTAGGREHTSAECHHHLSSLGLWRVHSLPLHPQLCSPQHSRVSVLITR